MTFLSRLGWRCPSTSKVTNGLDAGSLPWRATHRHRKGGEYRVIGFGTLEADRSEAVIYDDCHGQIWIRARNEFYDGRFVAIHDNIEG